MEKLLATLLLTPLLASADVVTPVDLRTEHLVDPIGIDVSVPRLSWRMDDPAHATGRKQSAYRVLVAPSKEQLVAEEADLWDSGKIASDQSHLITYAGTPLTSHTEAFWKVRLWTEDGSETPWSTPARFTIGLLETSDWQGPWITYGDNTIANTTEGFTADCPHRERMGYGEVAFATAWGIGLPNFQSGAFYAKYVRD